MRDWLVVVPVIASIVGAAYYLGDLTSRVDNHELNHVSPEAVTELTTEIRALRESIEVERQERRVMQLEQGNGR